MNELISRRRDDRLEEGQQAAGVILPDKAAYKINEGDGKATHAHTLETLSQYLNGETMFSGEDTIGLVGLRKTDPNAFLNIPKNGFRVRIIASIDHLIFIFETNKFKLTPFQLNVIEHTVADIEKAYHKGTIKYPYINFLTGNDRFVFNEKANIDEELDRLKSIISKRKEELNSKVI